MKYTYETTGVCPQEIIVELEGNIVKDVQFSGGCNGNLKAIRKVVQGMTVDEIEETFSGITCGRRPTSCTDQLSKAVRAASLA